MRNATIALWNEEHTNNVIYDFARVCDVCAFAIYD
jgi:hypothetical protein